jgi:hypothetical protein
MGNNIAKKLMEEVSWPLISVLPLCLSFVYALFVSVSSLSFLKQYFDFGYFVGCSLRCRRCECARVLWCRRRSSSIPTSNAPEAEQVTRESPPRMFIVRVFSTLKVQKSQQSAWNLSHEMEEIIQTKRATAVFTTVPGTIQQARPAAAHSRCRCYCPPAPRVSPPSALGILVAAACPGSAWP